MNRKRLLQLAFLCLSITSPEFSSVLAQSTAFTYDGRLNDGGKPADGQYDLTFMLFGASNGGSAIAGPLANSPTPVTNGLFTVTLDFGAGAFPGENRWLEIGVRTNGGGAFTTLGPRQKISSTPYAIQSANAASALSVSGSVSAAQLTGTISPNNIGEGSIISAMLAAGAVGSNQVAAGAVTTAALADGAVTAGKIATVIGSNWFALTITNPTPADSDSFGSTVAALGSDRFLVGAPGGVGAAYLFSTNSALLTTFINPTPAASYLFGISVAAAGSSDRVLISAPQGDLGAAVDGVAYLFRTNGPLLTTFTNPIATLGLNHQFGWSVAAVGSGRVLIGAPRGRFDQNVGAAYLFSNNGTWLHAFTGGHNASFGYSVSAVGGDRVLIGEPRLNNPGTGGGRAYLFSTNGTFPLTIFTSPNPSPVLTDQFGRSVAAVGTDRVLIGAPADNTGAPNAGAAYLFSTNGTLLTTFTNPTPAVSDSFGYSVVAVGTDRVLIGAPDAGAAYLFSTNGALLTTFNNPTPEDSDGFSSGVAALGSDRVLIAAPRDNTGAASAGVAYLFSLSFETYTPGLIADGVGAGSITTASLEDRAVTAAKLDSTIGVWNRSGDNVYRTIGNVGIGTATPMERLSVAGDIIASDRISAGGSIIAGGNIIASDRIFGNGASLTNLNASQLASGTVPAAALGNAWKVGGNAGTTPGPHFLGTTDNQPLELKVNGARGWRLEPGTTPNVIGGDSGNTVAPGAIGAVIAGGLGHSNQANFATIGGGQSNVVSGIHGVVGGGVLNRASGSPAATVAGGLVNTAGGNYATVGGGRFNTALAFVSSVNGGQGNVVQTDADHSVIGGGLNNLIDGLSYRGVIAGGGGNTIGVFSDYGTISGGQENDIAGDCFYVTIGGGYDNNIGTSSSYSVIGGGTNNNIAANSDYATIPGGDRNFATNRAFAAGTRAKASHTGAFVWADSQNADFASSANNQFLIRAGGGVGMNVAQPLGELHVGISSGAAPISLATQTIIIDNANENGRAAFLALAGPGGSSSSNRVELELEANESQRVGIIGTTSNHEVQFRENNITRLRLATNGNIGINLSNPSEQLHVNGNILATGTITPNSDRNAKTDVKAVDTAAILERVAKLPIRQWRFKAESEQVKHVGPMAQDFYAAFGLGSHETAIATVDADGVALAAIQGLNQKLEEQLKARDAEIRELRQGLAELKAALKNLTTKHSSKP